MIENNLIDENIARVKGSLENTHTLEVVPEPYKKIAERFEEVKRKGESVILEEGSFPHTDSTVVYIEHIADRWVGGYSITRHEGKEIKLPKTIHYSDIYIQDKSHKVKIIFEGANPYE